MPKYHELLTRLYSVNRCGGVKLGLDNIHALCHALNDPEKRFGSVHIAGTNGKGSVACMLAKGLQESHEKVGLFTSPHISSFRERIQVNGKLIEEREAAELLEHIFSIIDSKKIPATFFEITTALSFAYFAAQNVDIAVIESGLGGRLDATNVVTPLLSIITSIQYDHMDILGDTLDKIAHEKAGIIKPGVPVILGPSAATIKAPLSQCLLGPFASPRAENQEIARAALHYLQVSENGIKNALKAFPPCRMERLNLPGVPVVLDIAHNPASLDSLFKALNLLRGQIRALFNLSQNKDQKTCLKTIMDSALDLEIAAAPHERLTPPETLRATLLELGAEPERVRTHKTMAEGMARSVEAAREKGQLLVVCGSFFIMSDARLALGIKEPRDPVNLNETFSGGVQIPQNARSTQ